MNTNIGIEQRWLKYMCVMALFIALLDCVGKAIGDIPQNIFPADYIWAWWIVASGWVHPIITMFLSKVVK